MSTLIQIRGVPEEMHEKLKARAASQGKSLNSYMLEIVEREVERPTFSEVVARIRAEGPLGEPDDRSAADYLHEAREERDAQLASAISRRPVSPDDRR
ncbi:MAG: FitA-like ribbon-helix-helix domain-containing protein [Solirubrobacteraceae bacterium]